MGSVASTIQARFQTGLGKVLPPSHPYQEQKNADKQLSLRIAASQKAWKRPHQPGTRRSSLIQINLLESGQEFWIKGINDFHISDQFSIYVFQYEELRRDRSGEGLASGSDECRCNVRVWT